MTRVFLSYAGEDSVIAARVDAALRARGAEVYRFEDPERLGDRFMQTIPREIEQADVFVALLSPAAIASTFCTAERNIAFHREFTVGEDFVYALEVVADTPKEGWLRPLAWIDLTPQVTEEKLANALAALPLTRSLTPQTSKPTTFRNRTDELNRILDGINTAGGDDYWLVLSPPKMGKSWFLREVGSRFEPGSTTLIDLRDEELDIRYDAISVLCRLLNVPLPAAELDADARLDEIAGTVALRACPQLVLLDSAELLDRTTTACFRRALARVQRLIRDSPFDTRLSIVVASRRVEGWIGAGFGDRFHQLWLTGFELSIIRKVLEDTKLAFQPPILDMWTGALYKLSRGLPALLVSAMDWANGKGFVNPGSYGNGTTFETVVAPYIRRELLSMHSLLPEAGEKLVERHAAVVAALQAMAPYRIVTQSHLKYHLDQDPEFAAALDQAGWSRDDLWTALAGTALLDSRENEMWLSHYPPIRQLLYEHFYRDNQEKHATNQAARAFYNGWSGARGGSEQAKVLVECLWHEAMMLRCATMDLPGRLPEIAVELTQQFIRPEAYEPAEIVRGVRKKLINDEEFNQLVDQYDGLFDEVVTRISTTIAGGG